MMPPYMYMYVCMYVLYVCIYVCISVCVACVMLTKALALLCHLINKHLSTDNITIRCEQTIQICISVLLRKMIDKQVTTIRALFLQLLSRLSRRW